MKKIFIIGHGPLPGESNVKCQTAFGLRTWQFLSLVDNTDIHIQLILITNPAHYDTPPIFYKPQQISAFNEPIELIRVEKNHSDTFRTLKHYFKAFQPDICLGINLPAAYLLSRLNPKVPFWADLNGWAMTEGQSQAWIEENNHYLPFLWHQEKNVLSKADKISTVSSPQKYATYGELATLGRLNAFTDEYELVTTIPNANETSNLSPLFSSNLAQPNPFLLRKKLKIPEDSFVVFFSGAYNTWLDSETMFSGLEDAMKARPNIHFVSTGGAAAVSNKSLEQFKQAINHSPYKKRFHFLGWLNTNELHQVYQQVNLAINIDRPNHEAVFGARNRINEWIHFGVPVLSTIRSEISLELFKANALLGIYCRDVPSLSQKIIAAADNQIDLEMLSHNAKKHTLKYGSYKITMQPLIEWLRDPKFSPDTHQFQNIDHPSLLKKFRFYLRKEGLTGIWKKIRQSN